MSFSGFDQDADLAEAVTALLSNKFFLCGEPVSQYIRDMRIEAQRAFGQIAATVRVVSEDPNIQGDQEHWLIGKIDIPDDGSAYSNLYDALRLIIERRTVCWQLFCTKYVRALTSAGFWEREAATSLKTGHVVVSVQRNGFTVVDLISAKIPLGTVYWQVQWDPESVIMAVGFCPTQGQRAIPLSMPDAAYIIEAINAMRSNRDMVFFGYGVEARPDVIKALETSRALSPALPFSVALRPIEDEEVILILVWKGRQSIYRNGVIDWGVTQPAIGNALWSMHIITCKEVEGSLGDLLGLE